MSWYGTKFQTEKENDVNPYSGTKWVEQKLAILKIQHGFLGIKLAGMLSF